MNITGEYTIQYNIYTMFDVYEVKITNHNLITSKGYEFFLKKWYYDDEIDYPFILGYYHENRFYERKNIDDTYELDVGGSNRNYDKSINYIDRDSYKQYRFDGENFVGFNEKIEKIAIGKCEYTIEPSESDTDLNSFFNEHIISDFERKPKELVLKCELGDEELNGTTEIGVKTNHGRLVSHDIHPPYNLPLETTIILEYVFKLE